MRISDWSSDVCSSDLCHGRNERQAERYSQQGCRQSQARERRRGSTQRRKSAGSERRRPKAEGQSQGRYQQALTCSRDGIFRHWSKGWRWPSLLLLDAPLIQIRSVERRVGKGGGSSLSIWGG